MIRNRVTRKPAPDAGRVGRDRRPLALIVRDGIRDLLLQEHVAIGDQLPSEADLASRFQVARTTVREALKLLEQDGLIDVQHGRGRFVTALPSDVRPITRLESVTEMMAGLGYDLKNVVLDRVIRDATPAEAEALRLKPGERVLCLERFRLHASDVLIYSVDVLPERILTSQPPRAEDWSGSLLAILAQVGQFVAYASAQIRADRLPPTIAERAGLDAAAPWLLLVQVNINQVGEPIIFSTDYHKADEISFHVLRRRAR